VNSEAPIGYAAREIVLERILMQAMRFPDLDITPFDPRSSVGAADIDPRDAALARAIEYAVVRRYLTLLACVRPHLQKAWPLLEKPVQAALLGGAAQILFLDRVPAAAAVDASVEWTKRRLRAGAGGLVNAVLRKVAASVVERVAIGDPQIADHTRRDIVPLADGSALRLSCEAFNIDASVCLSEKTSHSRELILHWVGAFGFKEATRLAMHDLLDAPLLVTPYDATDARFDLRATPHNDAGFGVWTGSHGELTETMALMPNLRVQDPTACATVAAIGPMLTKKPRVIVDLCAGRGTKTRQLAEMFPNAEIYATDPDDARFEALARLRLQHPQIKPLSPQSLFRDCAGRADLLLLDVPCSNSGVLARRPEARYRFSKGRTASVIELQQKICDPAVGLLAAGGAMIYATCSIERGENEAQTKRLASRFSLSLVVERNIVPTGVPGEAPAMYRDGGYHALLVKT
jgi:16S rRNA (cytosine967-C5)-methyltransferase